jgi:hypothetical protein
MNSERSAGMPLTANRRLRLSLYSYILSGYFHDASLP